MQEKLAKARARTEIHENVDFGKQQKLQEKILENRQQSLHSKQTMKENPEATCNQQDSDYLDPVYQAE